MIQNIGVNSYTLDTVPMSRRSSYGGGYSSSNNAVASSAINQHRNSIEQRIANLQAKILKKSNLNLDACSATRPINQNCVSDYVVQQYPLTRELNNLTQKQKITFPNEQVLSFNANLPNSNANLPNYKPHSTLNNDFLQGMNHSMPLNKMALKEKHISDTNKPHANTTKLNGTKQHQTNLDSNSKKGAYTQTNSLKYNDKRQSPIKQFNRRNYAQKPNQEVFNYERRMYSIQMQQGLNSYKDQNNRGQQEAKQNSLRHNNLTRKGLNKTVQTQIKKQKPTLRNQQQKNPLSKNLQQDITNLSNTISNLRSHSGNSQRIFKDQLKRSLSPLKNTLSNNSSNQNQTNGQLYQMMRGILVGQERIEKELQMLKNREKQAKQIKQCIQNNQTSKGYNYQKRYQRGDHFNGLDLKSKSRSKSARTNNQNKSYSPTHSQPKKSPINSQRSVSPRQVKGHNLLQSAINKSQRSVSPQQVQNRNVLQKIINNSQLKRNRATSAINAKSVNAGKIARNKQRFYQLYKQAQLNKKLNRSKSRIKVSEPVISTLFSKIKAKILQSQQQNKKTSTFSHENNRYVNDHMVNTIQLQKKHKNDLVKKIYDMCQNKCLFK